ncbi:MAG: hypothetical protein RLZZ230_255 [Candidatus Parcubacteria bacterium]|jgi:hypothetical protein
MKNSHKIATGDFYYHYKHNPEGEINNFAYGIIGTALHTETENLFIIYKPLYQTEHKLFARPHELFTGAVILDDVEIPRFSQIFDPNVISKLKTISGVNNEMI